MKSVWIDGIGGNDTLRLGAADGSAASLVPAHLSGGPGNDTLVGTRASDLLVGGSGDDTVQDTDGSNILDGGAGLDTINGVRESAEAPVYEAELATISGAVVASNHTNYTGTGFVDYVHNAGDYVEWPVDAVSAGVYALTFRYANGSASERPLTLTANGLVVQAAPLFAPTGSFDVWPRRAGAAPTSTRCRCGRSTWRRP